MKRIFILLVLLSMPICVQSQGLSRAQQFPVFDAIGMGQKPNLSQFGLKPIMVVDESYLWEGYNANDTTSLPDKSRVTAIARAAKQTSDTLVIDIEHWPLTGDANKVSDSLMKYRTVLQWAKSSVPSLNIGLYGAIPVRNYWDAVQGLNTDRYHSWQKVNDALSPLGQASDTVYPSIYTFYDDRDGWKKYAIAQIAEARRVSGGKPVYVFLWPQYHMSNKTLGLSFLPGDYWRMELETARQYADGVVIWCCGGKQTWDDKAPWWLETRKFIAETAPR